MSTRFFKVDLTALNAIRDQVMLALEQPNGRADEPWPANGSFSGGEHGYVALGEHHTTGWFAPLLTTFLSTPGVEEISETTYRAAQPEPDLPPVAP